MRRFKETVIVFSATALSFLSAFALHFFLGRFLGPTEYGQYGVVLNIAWITGIPLGVLGLTVIKFSAVFNAKKDMALLKGLIIDFMKFSLILNLLFAVFYLLFSVPLSDILGGGLVSFIIVLAVSFPFSGVSGVFFSFIQGVGKVYPYSLVTVLGPILKLVFAVILVLSGFGVFGALLSLTISSIGLIIICLFFVRDFFKTKAKHTNRGVFLRFTIPVLFANLFFNLVLYFDLFFVSSLLGAEQAGYYNAAVTLSRAFLMSSAVLAVFFPEFNKDSVFSDSESLRSNLKWALLYTGFICLAGITVFWLFGDLVISITYSSSFLPAVPLLKVLSIGYSFFSLFNVLLYALWSFGKHKIVGFFGLVIFVLDLILLSLIIPSFGVIGAAWITAGLMGLLFVFSLIVVYFKVIKKGLSI